ncbi:MAG: SUMF1/EgtB/PvdO family nonheme iron enzyme [Anaerolineae bacterium]|nr:SUMF1/EgtB/PvdO family nonheme iron enzyme [Anaerolineae bacterium]
MNLVGQTLGQYELVEMIGMGGMATVYKAYQPNLNRYVAIKVLSEKYALTDDLKKRFLREAKAVAQLSHPNILPIFDVGTEGDWSYLVMKYVAGHTLSRLLGRPMSLSRVGHFLNQLAGALDHAHAKGIIHRDIKPVNILVENDWLFLADFGLAKIIESSTFTSIGTVVGTPEYISPEQADSRPVDHRTDIYALGIVLYEMVTGRVPYQSETPMGIMFKHVYETPPAPRSLNPNLPEEVEQAILKAMAKAPGDRYNRSGELAEALRQAIDKKVSDEQASHITISTAPKTPPRPKHVKTDSAPAPTPPPRSTSKHTLTLSTPLYLELVQIPAGEFLMGSAVRDKNAQDDEKPQHTVYVSEFYITKYPVTNEQYAAFVKMNNYRTPDHWADGQFPPDQAEHPVVYLWRDDAIAFCKWLSQETGHLFRLPTEAEWEKAARGAEGQLYPWGNEWEQVRLNCRENGLGETTPVGHYSPEGDSPYQVAEMSGNVWEWCTDWFGEREYKRRVTSTVKNPTGPQKGKWYVLRGGSFDSNASLTRCAYRGKDFRFARNKDYGFRVVQASGWESMTKFRKQFS